MYVHSVLEQDSKPPWLTCIVSRVMSFMFWWAVQLAWRFPKPIHLTVVRLHAFIPSLAQKRQAAQCNRRLFSQPAPLPFHAQRPHCAVSKFSCPICAPTGAVGLQNEVWTDALLKRRYLKAVERNSTSSHSVWNSFPHWTVELCCGQCSVQGVIRKSPLLCVRRLNCNWTSG